MSHSTCPICCLLTGLPPAIRERETLHLADIAKTYQHIARQTKNDEPAKWFKIYEGW